MLTLDKQSDEKQDQSDGLQQIINEVNDKTKHHEEQEQRDENVYEDIDVLNLPPRKEIHSQKKSILRVTFKRPFLRFLFVIILMTVIIVGAIYLIEINGQLLPGE